MKKIFWMVFISAFFIATLKILAEQKYLFGKDPMPRKLDVYGEQPAVQFSDSQKLSFGTSPIQLRGDRQRSGVVEGKIYPSYRVAWRFKDMNGDVHTAAKGSPVADETGIYIGSDMGWLFAFNWDGTLKWKIYNEAALQGIHGTPVIDGDFLFYGDYAGSIFAVNKNSGEIIWTRNLGSALGASPLVLGDVIYANVEMPKNGYIAKLEKKTGHLIFKTLLFGEQSHSSLSYDATSDSLFFGANNKKFFSLNPETGKMNWEYQSEGVNKSTSLVHKGVVYYTDWGPHFRGLDIKTGKMLFKYPLSIKSMSSPALFKEGIVVQDLNNFYSFSLDGKLLKMIPLGNKQFMSSPVVVKENEDESVLTVCHDRKLCALEGKEMKPRVLFEGKSGLTATPFVYENKIVTAERNGDLVVLEGVR